MSSGETGYTITELMITVAILGILASIASPQYLQYVRESRRADAISSITRILAQQELFFANNNSTYTTFVASLGFKKFKPATDHLTPSGDDFYKLRLTVCTGGIRSCVQVRATPVDDKSQKKDLACKEFVATSQGRQFAKDSNDLYNNEECWK